jgi:hypothetical protein
MNIRNHLLISFFILCAFPAHSQILRLRVTDYGFIGGIPIVKPLFDATRGFVKKRDDDGSRDLVCFFEKMNSLPLYVKVCGVNADCCVHVTVAGLIRLLPSSKIEIIKDACGWSLDYHKDHRAWKSYGKHPNLNFV